MGIRLSDRNRLNISVWSCWSLSIHCCSSLSTHLSCKCLCCSACALGALRSSASCSSQQPLILQHASANASFLSLCVTPTFHIVSTIYSVLSPQSPRHHLPVVPESAESHPLPGVQPLQVADYQDRAGPADAHHAGPLPLQHAGVSCQEAAGSLRVCQETGGRGWGSWLSGYGWMMDGNSPPSNTALRSESRQTQTTLSNLQRA